MAGCLSEFHKKLSLKRLGEDNGNDISGKAVLDGLESLDNGARKKR